CKAKNQDHKRVYRGLFKCYKHSKVFNADLVGAYNILLKTKTIPPSPALHGVGVMRLRPGAELNPENGNVAPNLPETLALYGGKEVSFDLEAYLPTFYEKLFARE
ncbi:MAG: hypothetical protein QXW24_01685, partial [Ignisphaera sp.]